MSSSSTPIPKTRRSKHKVPPPPSSSSSPLESTPPMSSLKSLFLWEPPDALFPNQNELLTLFAAIAISLSVFLTSQFLANHFSTPPMNPFCDSSLDSTDVLSEHCEPCPSNARCYDGKFECVRGYKKHGNLCVEDGDINQIAKKLSEWVQSRLCKSYAQNLCGRSGIVWVEEDNVWNDLDENEFMRNFGLDSAINDYTKQKAMETINTVFEIKTNSQVKELKCPDSLAESYKPVSCQVKQWASNNVQVILPVCVLILGLVLLILKVNQKLYLSKRVDELYHQVCEALEESALASKGISRENEPWVVASMLRDHLLSPKERKNPVLWKKVEELVQEDTRVDRYPKLVKGEQKVVWEWQVEGSLSSSFKMKNKGESSKLKPNLNSKQNLQRLKFGELA